MGHPKEIALTKGRKCLGPTAVGNLVMVQSNAYRLAELKIEKARATGAKELDLSDYSLLDDKKRTEKLTAVPNSLGRLTQLESLDLGGNNLTSLPEWLGQLTQLESLDLRGNQVTALPESVGNLTQLKSLNLEKNLLRILPGWLGQLTQLQSLNLANNQLTLLPDSLGQLTKLKTLLLCGNQLSALPESLGQLTRLVCFLVEDNQISELPPFLRSLRNLEDLRVSNNPLRTIPEWIGELKNLQLLEIANNSLTELPVSISELTLLHDLYLGDLATKGLREGRNTFSSCPECLRSLRGLKVLWLNGCSLKIVPDWICELAELHSLNLEDNQLTDLPMSMRNLPKLLSVYFDRNPLNHELAAAYADGLDAVKRYLTELAKGAQARYEAKLLILGDGNEGKTCVSRALRGLPFKQQKTTRGVDVVPWKFTHPDHIGDETKAITLNVWDFEGQEISHQTHQFFLTSQSLYLLVFKCRDQFLLDRAEYWLDTIRARAPKAKVAVVISQCEGRMPLVPLDRIQAQYGDLLTKEWFFPVGCENGLNIPKLRAFLQRSAADLEFIGKPWPISYGKAEKAIETRAKSRKPSMERADLERILKKAGVDEDGYDDAAAALSRLGKITQFPDCPDLRDFIVLRPQWLTKAISKVMEDGQLYKDQGEIALRRMESMWKNDYPGLFVMFHNCMKEFELCYDLESGNRGCLVPLRFGYLKPEIPWTEAEELKIRRVEYKLNIRPPLGIMSRFIVKTHHLIVKTNAKPKGVYWHNGVFLRSGEGPLQSEALCEFIPDDRRLCIEVRAAYPQNMCEQIHAYVNAVFSFFSGLKAERSYGCIKVGDSTRVEGKCSGLHTEKRIYTAISKERETIDCEFESHEVDPRRLVSGLGSFGEYVKERGLTAEDLHREFNREPEWAKPFLVGIDSLQRWVEANATNINKLLQTQYNLSAEFKQESELKLFEYLSLVNKMLDDRDFTAAPGLFSLNTVDKSRWNPRGYFQKTFVLTPFCECPGNIHACKDGATEFTKDKIWWEKTAPWVARATKFLSVGLKLAFSGMPLALGDAAYDPIKNDVEFMKELSDHMTLELDEKHRIDGKDPYLEIEAVKGGYADDPHSRLTRAALARLLEEIAPTNYRARQWGTLQRIRLSDNSYRWLCLDCSSRVR